MKKGEQPAEASAMMVPVPENLQFCRIASHLAAFAIVLDIGRSDRSAKILGTAFAEGRVVAMAEVRCRIAAMGDHGPWIRVVLNVQGLVDKEKWPALVDELERRAVCVDFAGVSP